LLVEGDDEGFGYGIFCVVVESCYGGDCGGLKVG
jgi:hypothetical protein